MINKLGVCWGWRLGLMGCCLVWPIVFCGLVEAQSIREDTTLGTEGSVIDRDQVIRGRNSDRIRGGARRGGNLFHSFEQFDVDEGRGAYFDNPAGVENIFSRVTGNDPSEIRGALGVIQAGSNDVLGTANLFFMNPNGILFGPSSSLDVGGSFVGTTANAIGFGDLGFFSATNPEVPSQLLTIDPSAFLFNQIPTGNIANTSATLQVNPGQSLTLLGGNITLDGGQLNAYGGRVEIGSVSGIGTIGFNADASLNFSDAVVRGDVEFRNGSLVDVAAGNGGDIRVNARSINLLERSRLRAGIEVGYGSPESQAGDLTLDATGNIQVGQSSFIANNVRNNSTGNGGNLNIKAGSLSVINGSQLSTSTFGDGNAGRVIISARDQVSFDGTGDSGSSGVFSNIGRNGVGNGSNIEITTGLLYLRNGARLNASTYGRGNVGNIVINAQDAVSFEGLSGNGQRSAVFNTIESGAVGSGGNIEITTRALSVTNGAQLVAATYGQGNVGNVIINADDSVYLDGVSRNGEYSTAIYNSVTPDATGVGGNIEITTGTFSAMNGAQLIASTFGQGNAGNVTINAHGQVLFDGTSKDGDSSGAFNAVALNAVGNGGNIKISAESLLLTNGATLIADTSGQGDAGNIIIDTIEQVLLDNTNSNGEYRTGAFSIVESGASGSGGNVQVSAGSLSVVGGAALSAITYGQGNAGNVFINVRESVIISGSSADGQFKSGANSAVETNAVGRGGNVEITADSLSVADGARLQAATRGQGDAGNIILNARDTISVTDGAVLFADTLGQRNAGNIIINAQNSVLFDTTGSASSTAQRGTGNGGNIEIEAGSLSLTGGATLSTNTFDQGNAGSVIIKAQDSVLLNGNGGAYSTVAQGATGDGGSLQVSARSLSVVNGAVLNASTYGQGDAGDVIINATDRTSFDGTTANGEYSSGAFSTVNSGAVGDGGNVQVSTGSLSLTGGAALSASTYGQGDAGDVIINAIDRISFDGTSTDGEYRSGAFSIVESEAVGEGGDIRISTGSLSVTNGATLNANTIGRGNAGDVIINAQGQVLFSGTTANEKYRSGAFSTVDEGAIGNGGNVEVAANSLWLLGGAQLNASTFGRGDSGSVIVNADSISFDGTSANGRFISGAFSVLGEVGIGNGGNVQVSTGSLSATRGAQLDSSTYGQGNAGDVIIDATDRISFDGTTTNGAYGSGAFSTVNAGAIGNGGNVQVSTGSLSATGGAALSASTSGQGDAGDVIINATDRISFDGTTTNGAYGSGAFSTVNAGAIGNGGNVQVSTGSLSATGGAVLNASTFGRGDAGDVIINATDQISFDGTTDDGKYSSGAISRVETGAVGNGGNVEISTGSLSVTDSAIVSATTFGAGDAGDVIINARDLVDVNGVNSYGYLAGIFATTRAAATGQGGSIMITTPDFLVADGAVVSARTENASQGGRVDSF